MQLMVGRVVRPHGVHGEVAIEVHTDDPELRLAAGAVLATEPAAVGPLTIASARWHSGRLLAQFRDCHDRNEAENLRGVLLLVDSDDLSDPVDPDEFRDYQLIGLSVVTPDGQDVGEVSDVLHHGQDLLVVRGHGRRAGAEILIPFVAAIVGTIDLEARQLHIDPPPGLLDPQDAI